MIPDTCASTLLVRGARFSRFSSTESQGWHRRVQILLGGPGASRVATDAERPASTRWKEVLAAAGLRSTNFSSRRDKRSQASVAYGVYPCDRSSLAPTASWAIEVWSLGNPLSSSPGAFVVVHGRPSSKAPLCTSWSREVGALIVGSSERLSRVVIMII